MASEKQDVVARHVALWARTPFSWADGRDCMLPVADYLLDLTGYDCGTRFRGKYRTALECARVSGFHRDPVKPFADCVAEFPLEATDDPQRGDVGVVDTGHGITGGICLGTLWAIRGQDGASIGTPLRILAAWRAPVPVASTARF